MPRVVVVGAGISGLSLAYRLQARAEPTEVLVLEPVEHAGGTMWTRRRDGFLVETGANGFIDTKTASLDLCRDLGLKDQLVEASEASSKNRFLFVDGRLRPMPRGLGGFLATDLLSWRGKIRFLTEPFRRRPKDLGDESIASFFRRRGGQEAADLFGDALVTGIYAGDPELLSLPACFPKFNQLERDHGSLVKGFIASARQRRREARARGEVYRHGTSMWSLRDGLRTLIETLTARLKTPPVFGVKVQRVEKQGDPARPSWLIRAEGKDAWTADALVLACPAHQQTVMLSELDPELADRIGRIPYNRVGVIALGYRRQDVPTPVDGFGFIAPQHTRRDVLGVQWASSIYPGRSPDGTVQLRAMCGGGHRGDMVDWDDERLSQAVRAELRQAMGITAAPIFQDIIRWPKAIPQYHIGHLDRLAWLERHRERHPGLFLAGNAYYGASINDCIEQGGIQAARVDEYVRGAATQQPG